MKDQEIKDKLKALANEIDPGWPYDIGELAVKAADCERLRSAYELKASAYNVEIMARMLVKLAKENADLIDASPTHCGQCKRYVAPVDAITIRSLDAPNPFCSRECVEAWSDR